MKMGLHQGDVFRKAKGMVELVNGSLRNGHQEVNTPCSP